METYAHGMALRRPEIGRCYSLTPYDAGHLG